MEGGLFQELIVVLALAVGIILLFRRLRLPAVLGFILAGMLAGPHMLGWVDKVETVELLAELGVIFLLFVIGMEFSLKKLASIGVTVLVGGSLQALLTIGLCTALGRLLGLPLPAAVFVGFLVTLSSTAIVLRILQEKGRMDAPFGRIVAAILIFQDILVVPMMLVTPMLAGKSGDIAGDLLWLLGKMLLLVVAVYVSGRFAVPRLLRVVSKGRNRELFIITIVVLCFAAAWATSALGLSLALGAFFAGLIISGTDQAYHATGIVQPFHELFMSFFFVSVGMLVDPVLFTERPFTVVGLTLLVMVVKTLAAFVAVWVLRHPVRTALQCGLALFQVGEFAFVLAVSGLSTGLLTPAHHQVFLGVSILTMGATPFVLANVDDLVRKVFSVFLPRSVGERLDGLMRVRKEVERTERRTLKDHVVIIGFGLNGQNVGLAAQSAKIRCAVVEEDPDLAELATRRGMHVVHGDATNAHILEKAHVEAARVVVVAIADAQSTRRIVASVRALTTAYLIVRTRYVKEIEANLQAGANEVVPEEFETSIEIFYRVLRKYLVPERSIQEMVAHIRGQHYGVLRNAPDRAPMQAAGPDLDAPEIAAIPIDLGRSRIVGRTLEQVDLRGRYGLTVLAIRRTGRVLQPIGGGERILQNDVLYVLGGSAGIARLDRDLN
ncbi:MAG: cation:proton antiporter [Bacteroidetes bacterium]|nr:cation:proton antiporter [Bacteroidota bacterium]